MLNNMLVLVYYWLPYYRILMPSELYNLIWDLIFFLRGVVTLIVLTNYMPCLI